MPIWSCHVLNCIALIHWSVDSTHTGCFFVRRWTCRHPNLNLIVDNMIKSLETSPSGLIRWPALAQGPKETMCHLPHQRFLISSVSPPRLWSKFWDQNWSGNRKVTRLVFLMTCLLFLFLFPTSCPLLYWSTPPAPTLITFHLKSKSLMAHLPVASFPYLGHPFSSPSSI